jgi:hypothetical protein
MATHTVGVGAFEDATGVAAVTTHILVSTLELETRAVVIERFLRDC